MKNSIKSRKHIIYLIGFALFLLFSIVVTIYIAPIFNSLMEENAREIFKQRIEDFGFGGIAIMLGIQILQVFIAFLPGEPIEILMGVMYGTIGGLLLSMIGCAIGSIIVFVAMRKFGQPLFEVFFKKKSLDRFAFLKNSKKLELFIFILFFIPGTPKDMLTYFAPLTRIELKTFILISVFARIPSIITSTYAGSSIVEGKWVKTLLIFLSTAVIGIAGIIIANKITDKQNKENRQ